MRTAVCLAVVAVLALTLRAAQGEGCRNATDCTTTNCNTGDKPICDNRICTCTFLCDPVDDLGRCRRREDCQMRNSNGVLGCTCLNAGLHCIDGECHCGYPSLPPV